MSQYATPRRATARKRRPKWGLIIPLVLVVIALVGAGVYAGLQLLTPNDYEGNGSGEVLVTVRSGESGCSGINTNLQRLGVVKDSSVFCQTVLNQPDEPVFQVGTFRLAERMSSQAALDALLDPENTVEMKAVIIEGWSAQQAFETLSAVSGLPLADFTEASKNYVAMGVPEQAPSIEGFLFPATYILEPDQTAEQILQIMVDRMIQALDEHEVPVEDRFEIVTMASIIQREARIKDDFYKVSRVFGNRLEIGMRLESDATVSYGTGRTDSVWTQPDERNDRENKYSTYAHDGLPIGPIGLPGDLAIDAAMNPAEGPWLYFVPINLETGETVYSETFAEHKKAAAQLGEWCEASRARGETYCD